MLPSMPILFTRDSQDAFGNKLETNAAASIQNTAPISIVSEPIHNKTLKEPPTDEAKPKTVNGNEEASSKPKEKSNKLAESVLDAALVRSYYTKVQSRFSAYQNMPTNKFVQFYGILKSFNPAVETPIDLYKKIEEIFGNDHKDLVEEFLLFLNPGQAAQLGRFMNHFVLVQMTSFIQMLHNTFSRKPTVLKKVLRALTTGINSGCSANMKARVLPHLHSSPRLLRKFLSLFPDERPPDSAYEIGTDKLNESFLSNDKGYDVWEFEEKNGNKRKLDTTKGLDSLYLNGRVFIQHGKMLRPARVTYPYSKEPYRSCNNCQGSSHPRFLSPEPDDERASPKKMLKCSSSKPQAKRSRKQMKLPTKQTKDVNDNTKHKDLITSSTSSPKIAKNKTVNVKSSNKKAKDKLDAKVKQVAHCSCAEEMKKASSKSRLKQDFNSVTQPDYKRSTKLKQNKTDTMSKTKNPPDITNGSGKYGDSTEKKHIKEETDDHSGKDVIEDSTKLKSEMRSWTREEDKTILEIIKGAAGSEQMFSKIGELLPHRSVTEIKERFCQVMDLLQQMAVGEVI